MHSEMTDQRQQAIQDCQYGVELDNGEGKYTALYNHIALWENADKIYLYDGDDEYHYAILEIKSKLFTEECLLKCLSK